MYEGLRSPNIYTPKVMPELSPIILEHPNATFWADGTDLMRKKDGYPSKLGEEEIIYLGEMEELRRFQRNDRMIEFGSMVTLDEFLSVARSVAPEVLTKNIESIGGRILTKRITIGGSLGANVIKSSIPGTLAILDASYEVRFIKRKRLHSKWYPISYMNGKGTIPTGLITHVRIPLYERNYQFFKSTGSFVRDKDGAVAVAFVANLEQNQVVDPHISFSYPEIGFITLREIDNAIQSLRFPSSPGETENTLKIVLELIRQEGKISPLQQERTKGILKEIIGEVNVKILSTPTTGTK